MNLESRFKAKLVDLCRARGAYARRLEDRYAIGLLDLTIKFPGHPHLLAEGKLVPHQSFAPSIRQWHEGESYRAVGGLCVLIGWDPKTKQMYVHEWAKTAKKEASFTAHNGDDAQLLLAWLDTRK